MLSYTLISLKEQERVMKKNYIKLQAGAYSEIRLGGGHSQQKFGVQCPLAPSEYAPEHTVGYKKNFRVDFAFFL